MAVVVFAPAFFLVKGRKTAKTNEVQRTISFKTADGAEDTLIGPEATLADMLAYPTQGGGVINMVSDAFTVLDDAPMNEHQLAEALDRYTNPNHPEYDAEFHAKVVSMDKHRELRQLPKV